MDPITKLLEMLGVKQQAGSIITVIGSSIMRIGDRKARLQAVEVAALTAAQYNRAVLDALKAEGADDITASLAKDALLEANIQTLGLLAKTVDIDGSLGSKDS
jgi:hypothetical protein